MTENWDTRPRHFFHQVQRAVVGLRDCTAASQWDDSWLRPAASKQPMWLVAAGRSDPRYLNAAQTAGKLAWCYFARCAEKKRAPVGGCTWSWRSRVSNIPMAQVRA
ncbi:hypothetical protein HRbin36_01454 [bacterium HR36]|nr:hypothetical protein HRbin36_01454 [bacterium HR36]